MRVEAGLAAQDFQRFEQRRRGLASADGDADGLEHLAGFDAELCGGGAQRGFQAIVRELGGGEHFAALSAGRVSAIAASPFLRDQFGGIVGRQFVDEEEIGDGQRRRAAA